jgi:phosphoribosylformylglycinamidine cyclo-ligase
MDINYKQSGVDVDAGDALVDWLQSSAEKQPHQDKIVSGVGGFASLFRADFSRFKKPCLVTCTDGVGTKVKIAAQYGRYAGIGQDLVAMCVNDLICCGAEPLVFLDYFATGKLQQEQARSFLQSVRMACQESHCALVGGETAEMPGVYQGNDFDCAGFAVGVVDEEAALGVHRVKVGQILIAVASSGFHSNGYSLLRKVFDRDLDQWSEELLKPTALYVKLMADLGAKNLVQAAAHITGGGVENIPRVLPAGTIAAIEKWPFSEPYLEVQRRTGMDDFEMMKTLNCGVGFVLVVSPADVPQVLERGKTQNHSLWVLGKVEAARSPTDEAAVSVGGIVL